MIKISYKDVKIGKNHTLACLVPALYDLLSAGDENTNSDNDIHNISTTISEAYVKMLPAIPINSKMIFLDIIHLSKKVYHKMLKF